MLALGKKDSGRTINPLGRKVIDTSFSYGRKAVIPKKSPASSSNSSDKIKSDLER